VVRNDLVSVETDAHITKKGTMGLRNINLMLIFKNIVVASCYSSADNVTLTLCNVPQLRPIPIFNSALNMNSAKIVSMDASTLGFPAVVIYCDC
jgi:hypothetical protein